MIRSTLPVIFLGLCFSFLSAQSSTEAGLFVGVSNYMGDLSPSPIAANETQFAFGAHYRYMLRPRLSIKGSVSFAKISGADVNKPIVQPGPAPRRWSMEAGLLELAVQGEWHPLASSRFNNAGLYTRQCSPFIGFGVGVAFAEAEVTTGDKDNTRFPEADDASAFIVFPITLGIRFDLSEFFILSGEFGLRTTLSDYLDGVSQNGNPNANDHYFMAGIAVYYLIESEYGVSAGY